MEFADLRPSAASAAAGGSIEIGGGGGVDDGDGDSDGGGHAALPAFCPRHTRKKGDARMHSMSRVRAVATGGGGRGRQGAWSRMPAGRPSPPIAAAGSTVAARGVATAMGTDAAPEAAAAVRWPTAR